MVRRVLLFCVFVLLSVALPASQDSASAYDVAMDRHTQGGNTLWTLNNFHIGGSAGKQRVKDGAAQWKVLGLDNIKKFSFTSGTTTNQVSSTTALPGPGIAWVTFLGCDTTWSGCSMFFDPTVPWYTGTGSVPAGKQDLWGVAAHEMGHWFGMTHADGGPDWVQYNPRSPTMWFEAPFGVEGSNINFRRTVQDDDISAARRMSSGTSNRTALALWRCR